MIDIQDIIQIHRLLINKYGGSHGIRELKMLLSSIHRPYQSFDGKDLYPTDLEKAAAICESLTINHPFIDGNKRIAFYMLVLLLEADNLQIKASPTEKRDLILQIAEGKLTFGEIVMWLKGHTEKIP